MRRIGIVSKGETLDSEVNECFGKGPKVIVAHWDNGQVVDIDVVDVPDSDICIGKKIAMDLARNYRIEAIITQHVGCGAYDIFEKKGVDMYTNIAGATVEQNADSYFSKNLLKITASNSIGGGRCGGSCSGCGH